MLPPLQTFSAARILAVRDLTPTVRLLQLETLSKSTADGSSPPKKLNFLPGQWVDFFVDDTLRAPYGSKIPCGGYSFLSSPHALPKFDLAIQRERTKRDSMTNWIHFNEECKADVELRVQVGGNFIIGDWSEAADGKPSTTSGSLLTSEKKTILIAGGIGLTPYMSFLRTRVDAAKNSTSSESQVKTALVDVTLLYTVKRMEGFGIFLDELITMQGENGLDLWLFDTGPVTGEGNTTTSIDGFECINRRMNLEDDLDLANLDVEDVTFYLCGPPAFSLEVEKTIKEHGPYDVRYENWWDPAGGTH